MKDSYIVTKEQFPDFFNVLKSLGIVFAPVAVSEQSYAFKKVAAPTEIALEALRTILPPKKFFYPQQETLVKFDGDKIQECIPDLEYQVIFGVHPCDLAGFGVLDKIFLEQPADTHYRRRREASFIVGLSCLPDRFCFCQSMGTECATGSYDLFLTDVGYAFFIVPGSAAGNALMAKARGCSAPASSTDLDQYKKFWNDRAKMFQTGFAPDNLRTVMDLEWDNPVWEELGERCLSCGNCTPVCPTCYCFDLVDIASLNGSSGERRREWDSCQFSGFAAVAGDFNFRPTPVDRLKFWYRHKLHGFDDPYGFKTCVGCGRCTVSCPAGIDDLVAVVKRLQANREGANEPA